MMAEEKNEVAVATEEVIEVEAKVVEPKEEKNELAEVKNTGLVSSPFSNTKEFKDLWNIASTYAKSDIIPAAYQNKPMNVMVAIDTANRTGLSVDVVMEHLNIIKGKKSWDGQSCIAIVKADRRYKKDKLVWVGEQGKDTYGAYVSAYDTESECEVKGPTVTIQMAKDDGWYGRNPKWKAMPEVMISYRAYALFARINLPNKLNGFMVEGEIEDIEGATKIQSSNVDDLF